jgi:hypothetical protein
VSDLLERVEQMEKMVTMRQATLKTDTLYVYKKLLSCSMRRKWIEVGDD